MILLLFLILVVLIGAFFPAILWGVFWFSIGIIAMYPIYLIYCWLKDYIAGDTRRSFIVAGIVLVIGLIIWSYFS